MPQSWQSILKKNIDIKTHCVAKENMQATSALFTQTKMLLISASHTYLKTNPTDFYQVYELYALHIISSFISNLKEIASIVYKIFIFKNVFFLIHTKTEIVLITQQTIFLCFNFFQMWYTCRALKAYVSIQWLWWNNLKEYLAIDYNLLSHLLNQSYWSEIFIKHLYTNYWKWTILNNL